MNDKEGHSTVSSCSHPIILKGLCALCGQDRTRDLEELSNLFFLSAIKMHHGKDHVFVSLEVQEKLFK
jgi:hypothetical protein